MREDIFTVIPDKEIPVSDEEIQAVQSESRNIFTRRGKIMSTENLKQFIMEVLADPAVGQQYKSTTAMPITMSSGKNIEIVSVSGPEGDKVITFSIDDGGKKYTIQRRWADIVGGKDGEWFAEAVTRAYGSKTYRASPGSVSALKKSGDSTKKAVGAGKFAWAENPYAAAQAAHIVSTGEPTVKKGSKRKKTAESDKKEATKCEECGTMYEGSRCNECGY